MDIFLAAYMKTMGGKHIKPVKACSDKEFEELKKPIVAKKSTLVSFLVILRRLYSSYFMDPMKITFQLLFVFGIIASIILVFSNINAENTDYNTPAKIKNMKSLLYQTVLLMYYVGFYNANHAILPFFLPFSRENGKRLYPPFVFYLCITLYQIPITIISCLIHMVATILLLDFNQGENFINFPRFFLAVFLTNIGAGAYGDLIAILMRDERKTS